MSDRPKILSEGQILAIEAARADQRRKKTNRAAIGLIVAIAASLIGYWIYLTWDSGDIPGLQRLHNKAKSR